MTYLRYNCNMRFRNIKKQIKKQEIKQAKYIYARFSDRVKSFITDMFMIYMPIMYFITYVVLGGKDELQGSETALFTAVSLYGVIYGILLTKLGQTPGKKAYDLKVVDDKTGNFIGFFRATCRFIMFLITMTTVLGAFLPFYRKDKKALHDLVCKTIVVKVKEVD